MSEDKILKNALDDNTELFRQCMKLMNECQEAEKRLEEAEKLLREWQSFVQDVKQLGVENCIKKAELDNRTERFLKKNE